MGEGKRSTRVVAERLGVHHVGEDKRSTMQSGCVLVFYFIIYM